MSAHEPASPPALPVFSASAGPVPAEGPAGLDERAWTLVECGHCASTTRTRVRGRSIRCKGCRRYVYVLRVPETVLDSRLPDGVPTITTQGGHPRPITDDAVAAHVSWMRGRGLAENTVRTRAQNLLALAARFEPRPLLELEHADLLGWQCEQAGRVAPGTLRALLVDARQFYRWATREQLLSVDPTARLDLPRVPRRAPRPIADVRLERALEAAGAPVRAMLVLAAFAGAKACEVAHLRWEDVDEDLKTLRLRGKGGHERMVPLAPQVVEALEQLAVHYAAQGLPARGPVLRNGYGRPGPVPAHHVSHHANRHLRACGIRDTFHALRHRFGTRVYAACKDIRLTRDLLGHASIGTTELYVGADESGSRAAVLAASLSLSPGGVR